MLWRKLHLNWRYALGEFAIVLLGVLAALWVQNWNGDRNDRMLEHEYVQSLLDDLQADVESFESTLRRTELYADYINITLRSVDSQSMTASPSEFVFAASSLSRLTFPAESRGAINDLMSTGNLRLIESEKVRSGVADYYTKLDWNAQWREVWRGYQQSMAEIMPELVDSRFRQAFLIDADRIPWVDPDVSVSEVDAQTILQRISMHPKAKPAIENILRTQGLNYRYVLDSKDEAQRLEEILREYIAEL